MARDYEVEGVGLDQDCDICKETGTAHPVTGRDETAEQTPDPSNAGKREQREHCERREHVPVAATRAANRRSKRLHS